MRLARFAAAGLALGLAAGFVSALLRPRSRHELGAAPSRSLTQATGQPINWGRRPPGSTTAAAPGSAARFAAPFAPNGTGPGSVAR